MWEGGSRDGGTDDEVEGLKGEEETKKRKATRRKK